MIFICSADLDLEFLLFCIFLLTIYLSSGPYY